MSETEAIALVEVMKAWYTSTEDNPDLEYVSRTQYLELKLQHPAVFKHWTTWLYWEYKKGVK